jgi:hypothetical protein
MHGEVAKTLSGVSGWFFKEGIESSDGMIYIVSREPGRLSTHAISGRF